jgi:predicted nucleotidyltransferase
MQRSVWLSESTTAALSDWAQSAGCRLLVLFGSAASREGALRPPRDVDLAILCHPPPGPDDRLRIIGELQDLVDRPDVDVVFLHDDTNPVLRFEVFRGGTPLFSVDILGHDLASAGVVPESYRKTFLEAGRHGILPADLASSLADAGGMRNILVPLYEETGLSPQRGGTPHLAAAPAAPAARPTLAA